MTTFGKTLVGLFILVIVILGLYFYLTRPVAGPSASIESQVTPVETTSTTPAEKHVSIVPQESKAQFSLDEDLRGKRTHVVGVTGDVAGDIVVTQNPAQLTIGEVKINARTLKTDSEQRNGALGRFILKSEDPANEFIVFKTTSVSGLPPEITTETEFSFQVVGDLTIKGVTKSVTFGAKATLGTDGILVGNAKATVTYADFGISVPDLAFLANVQKTTDLEINFIAK